ncbi:MAG: 50S ribosomal protein L6 [Candidatus Omnitrophica bacterium]|nr:50S ribosomal protein L6 [Candidatus Omnitrophota bacterium]MBU2251302.1 50S ribosomal protein L6 [Candidatus Omnitrophota bacterium]MBU2266121.1 50S ribosomal protein L6 [Candidatus Omnitrophota bacterium]MBU2474196.1 50S ribosomal protein L6 [Candidatus Omnitrophota bacterium]
MSRIGQKILEIPKGVKVVFESGRCIVEAAKNKLELNIPQGINLEITADSLTVKRANDSKALKSLHGTIRMLINNMIEGVTKGYRRELDIIGVGYKAQMKEKNLLLNVGYSHPVEMEVPEGLKVTCSGNNMIIVEGIDKQKVGEFTANVRRVFPPEPYKGKGIRYRGEEVRKKLGKALAKQ